MEQDASEFLKRVGTSLSIALVWLCINVTAAIVNDNAFIKGEIRLANVLYYIWFVASTIALVIIFKKIWGKSFRDGKFYEK